MQSYRNGYEFGIAVGEVDSKVVLYLTLESPFREVTDPRSQINTGELEDLQIIAGESN